MCAAVVGVIGVRGPGAAGCQVAGDGVGLCVAVVVVIGVRGPGARPRVSGSGCAWLLVWSLVSGGRVAGLGCCEKWMAGWSGKCD